MPTTEIPEGKLFWTFDSPLETEGKSRRGLHSTAGTHPILLFIHAGVSDHTLWDEQVAYCTARGWSCLSYDVFGYGKSIPSKSFITKGLRPPVRHYEHAKTVTEAYLESKPEHPKDEETKFVVIGLSRGGGIAIDFVLSHPNLVSGLVVCAGVLGGFDIPNSSAEERMFDVLQKHTDECDIKNAARTLADIWGDGPLQTPGRSSIKVRDKLYEWCKKIVKSEISRTGGFAIPFEEVRNPPAAKRLPDIKVQTIVATGTFDESSTTKAMEYLAQHAPGATLKEFEAAHMVNLECSTAFNEWIVSFLEQAS